MFVSVKIVLLFPLLFVLILMLQAEFVTFRSKMLINLET